MYRAEDYCPNPLNARLFESLSAAESVVLKKGAVVVLTKNIDPANDLVNGSQGIVVGFSKKDLPIVKFKNSERIINFDEWSIKMGDEKVFVHRILLVLDVSRKRNY